MGWCQEFGPQISEGCGHAMVAGPSACSCSHCGVVCTGKFGGCANVWSRGPGQTFVRVAPVQGTLSRKRSASASADLPTPDAQDDGDEPADVDSGPEATGLDQLLQRVTRLEKMEDRLDALVSSGGNARILAGLEQLSGRVSALEGVPERVKALEEGNGRMRSMEKVLKYVVNEVDRIVTQTAGLEDITNRVAALERSPSGDQQPPVEVVRRLEPVPEQPRALEELSGRVSRLEQAVPPPAESTTGQTKALAAAQAHLERLTAHVAALQAVPKRVEALEQAQGHSSALGKAVDGLRQNVEELSAQVTGLQQLPKEIGTLQQSQERIQAIERGLDEISARLQALQHAQHHTDTTLDSLGKRFDRLSTRVVALKEAPERLERLEKAAVEADIAAGRPDRLQSDLAAVTETIDRLGQRLHHLEQGSVRSDNLARGLSTAIETLDQLSAQVAGIERTVHGAGKHGESPPRGH